MSHSSWGIMDLSYSKDAIGFEPLDSARRLRLENAGGERASLSFPQNWLTSEGPLERVARPGRMKIPTRFSRLVGKGAAVCRLRRPASARSHD